MSDTSETQQLPPAAGTPASDPHTWTGASQGIQVSFHPDQFATFASWVVPAKRRLFSADSLLKIVQTIALIAALVWPVHDYFAYKRESAELALRTQRGEALQEDIDLKSSSVMQFTRDLFTELIELPGAEKPGSSIFRVRLAVKATNKSKLEMDCTNARLQIFLGTIREPPELEYAVRINSPGEKAGAVAWRPILDNRYFTTAKTKTKRINPGALEMPPGAKDVVETQGGLAFGILSPGERTWSGVDMRIRARRDSYVGLLIDYVLTTRLGESQQEHSEVIRNFSELGLQDESGRTIAALAQR